MWKIDHLIPKRKWEEKSNASIPAIFKPMPNAQRPTKNIEHLKSQRHIIYVYIYICKLNFSIITHSQRRRTYQNGQNGHVEVGERRRWPWIWRTGWKFCCGSRRPGSRRGVSCRRRWSGRTAAPWRWSSRRSTGSDCDGEFHAAIAMPHGTANEVVSSWGF